MESRDQRISPAPEALETSFWIVESYVEQL